MKSTLKIQSEFYTNPACGRQEFLINPDTIGTIACPGFSRDGR